MPPIVRRNVGLFLLSLALGLGAVASNAQVQPPSQVSLALIPSLVEPGEALAIRGTSSKTGLVTFAATAGRGILLPGMAGAPAVDRALTFVDFYGRSFGVDGRVNVVPLRATAPDALGQEHVRLRQVYQGLPVTAGELIVHLRGDRVSAANGHALADFPSSVNPAVAPGVGAHRR